MTELIRASEAAKRLGVSRTIIYRLIDNHILPSTEIAGFIVINADDLKRPEVLARKNGRPYKKTPISK